MPHHEVCISRRSLIAYAVGCDLPGGGSVAGFPSPFGTLRALKQAGAQEGQFLLIAADVPTHPGMLVVPIPAGGNSGAVGTALETIQGVPHFHVEQIGGAMVSAGPSTLARLKELVPVARPHLVEAFVAVEGLPYVVAAGQVARYPSTYRTSRRWFSYVSLSTPGWSELSWTAAPTGLDDARKRTTFHGRYAMTADVDHFLQECPVCGRSLQVSSDLTGRRVTCLHCRGRFLASSSTADSLSPTNGASFLLRRAEELIEIASRRTALCAARAADQLVQRSVASGSRLQSELLPERRSVGTLWRDLRGLGRLGP